MNWVIAGNSWRSWIEAVILVLVITLGAFFIKKIMLRYWLPYALNTRSHWDDRLVNLVQSTKLILFFAIGVGVGSAMLRLSPSSHQVVSDFIVFAVLLQVGLWANRAVTLTFNFWVQHLDGEMGEANAFFTAGILVRVFVWMVLLLLALQNMGVNITTLIAGLGVGGIAIGLALQQIAGDMFASLAIVFDKPFLIGDFIVLDTYSGTVERVGIKTTRIRSLTGEELIFPNTDLVKGRVQNFKRMEERRILFAIGVTYGTAIDKLALIPELIRQIVDNQPNARFDRAHLKSFGASSLDFEVVYYILSSDYTLYMDTQQNINLAILRQWEALGIQFAFPTQTLYVETSSAGFVQPPLQSEQRYSPG